MDIKYHLDKTGIKTIGKISIASIIAIMHAKIAVGDQQADMRADEQTIRMSCGAPSASIIEKIFPFTPTITAAVSRCIHEEIRHIRYKKSDLVYQKGIVDNEYRLTLSDEVTYLNNSLSANLKSLKSFKADMKEEEIKKLPGYFNIK